jgi:hypothetical protein
LLLAARAVNFSLVCRTCRLALLAMLALCVVPFSALLVKVTSHVTAQLAPDLPPAQHAAICINAALQFVAHFQGQVSTV